jgi:hypothetical protein
MLPPNFCKAANLQKMLPKSSTFLFQHFISGFLKQPHSQAIDRTPVALFCSVAPQHPIRGIVQVAFPNITGFLLEPDPQDEIFAEEYAFVTGFGDYQGPGYGSDDVFFSGNQYSGGYGCTRLRVFFLTQFGTVKSFSQMLCFSIV